MSTRYAPDGAVYAEAVEILLDLAHRWPDKADGRDAAEVLLSVQRLRLPSRAARGPRLRRAARP